MKQLLRSVSVILLFGLLFPVFQQPVLSQQSSQDAVSAAIDSVRNAKKTDFWTRVSELKEQGSSNQKLIRMALDDSSGKVRIASAYALYQLAGGDDVPRKERNSLKQKALSTLLEVAGKKNSDLRRLAADAIWHLSKTDQFQEGVQDASKKLKTYLSGTDDPKVRLSLARALIGVSGFSLKSREVLLDLLESSDEDTRFNAAVALARMDAHDEAKPVLESFSDEPTRRGALAQTLLEKIDLSRSLELENTESPTDNLESSSSSSEYPVVNEIIQKIEKNYADADKIDKKELIEGAAKGITNQLDPFSTYLSKEELESLKEGLDRAYGGIGAVVSMRDGYLTIEQPIYSGPAYDAGLRTNDQIVEVEGKSTYEKELQAIVKKLKGKPGTEVSFKVMRRGWTEPKEFTIERAKIDIKTAKHRMLPGDVGYIQIISFGENTDEEVRNAIQTLKSEGMKGLIVDVRNNSGGYLPTAISITDFFLKPKDDQGNKNMILSVRGRGRDRSFFAESDPLYEGPMSVLINKGSASASEIFSGTLQDHSRATVIGETSFGKGSVQQLLPLDSIKGSALKLTQAKYYLPSGRTPHRSNWEDKKKDLTDDSGGGIKPDVVIKPKEESYWFAYASEQLLETGRIDEYLKENKSEHMDLFKQLAEYDGNSWKKYPEFNSFYKSLDTKLNRDRVRRLLRNEMRRTVGDKRGKAFIVDYQSDIQVRRAILDVLEKRNISPGQFPPYKNLKEEIKKHKENQDSIRVQ